MQVKPTLFIGVITAFSLLTACGKLTSGEEESVSILSSVQPTQLFIGKKVGNSAERCVYAVQVTNAQQACQKNKCDVQAFYWPVQAINNGQRGLLVTECSTDQKLGTGQILSNKGPTGDSGILIFQPRREGEGLWQNVELPNREYGLQLATEAAEGLLTYRAGKYDWQENPD